MLAIYPLMIGTTEIVLLAAVALLLFGGKKLPQLMRSMGKGVKEFKEGVQGAPEHFQEGMNEGEETIKEPEKPANHTAAAQVVEEQPDGE